MTIREILAKVAKGETLTDSEKQTLSAYDPDAVAAAARKKAEEAAQAATKKAEEAEAAAKALQEKIEAAENANKPQLEQMQSQLSKLAEQLKAKADETAQLKANMAKAERENRLNATISKTGVRFVPGVDAQLYTGALRNVLGTLTDEQLNDEATVKTLVESFKAANPAAIADSGGPGSGGPAHDGGHAQPQSVKKVSGKSLIDLATNAKTPEQQAEAAKQLAELEAANAAGGLEIT